MMNVISGVLSLGHTGNTMGTMDGRLSSPLLLAKFDITTESDRATPDIFDITVLHDQTDGVRTVMVVLTDWGNRCVKSFTRTPKLKTTELLVKEESDFHEEEATDFQAKETDFHVKELMNFRAKGIVHETDVHAKETDFQATEVTDFRTTDVHSTNFHAMRATDFHAKRAKDFQATDATDFHTTDVHSTVFHATGTMDFQAKEATDFHPKEATDLHAKESVNFHAKRATDFHPMGGTVFHPMGAKDFHPMGATDFHPMGATDFHPIGTTDFHAMETTDFHVMEGTGFLAKEVYCDIKCHSKLPLQESPFGLTKLNENTVMVTIPDSYEIITVNVFPDLELTSTIRTGKRYLGLTLINETSMAVSCSHPCFCVDVLSTLGEVLTSVTTANGVELFDLPWYLTVNRKGRLLVSDIGKESVICFTSKGSLMWTYTARELGDLRGITTTNEGIILVVDKINKKVIQITEFGMFDRAVLTSKNGLNEPEALFFDDGSLFIYDKPYLKEYILHCNYLH